MPLDEIIQKSGMILLNRSLTLPKSRKTILLPSLCVEDLQRISIAPLDYNPGCRPTMGLYFSQFEVVLKLELFSGFDACIACRKLQTVHSLSSERVRSSYLDTTPDYFFSSNRFQNYRELTRIDMNCHEFVSILVNS